MTAIPVAPTLDELSQRWVDALEAERGAWWQAADVAAYALGLTGTKAERGRLVGELASLGHVSSGYVRALSQMAGSYGTEYRLPDVSQSLYRACIAAGRRMGIKAHVVLENALAAGHHVREVSQLGRRPKAKPLTMDATCGDCGAEVRVRLQKATGRQGLRCPLCTATAIEEGRDVERLPMLGMLA